ncbi:MAG TPA: amino acid adenylation domain-containing protein, partial [Thermoanaerobaculia bacterium]|nr:amino acid adenylation domain-containing protein [Thermoanaerobaculia bacterium]
MTVRPDKGEDVVDLFDRVCRLHNGDVAVEWRGRALSYAEIDRDARRLAARLAASGLGEGAVVALWLEDRALWIAALLACLRCGCAFAPLDPDWPRERLRSVLEDLEPALALVDGSAPDLPVARAVRLGGEPGGEIWEGPRAAVDPDALCYVYFTSGSTGRPKGIAGRRKGLSHFIRWEIEELALPSGIRGTQLASPAFDASLRDVLVPLCAGGRVCVPPLPPASLDAARLVRWMEESGVQLVHCVPSLFRALAQAPAAAGELASVRFVLLAGEELRVPDVAAWRERFGRGATLVNLYGATETTMVKLFHVVRDEDLERGFIPIGKPMAGARALLLQEDLTVTRPGAVGEIYLRSPYMTLGYYRQPGKTREVFLPNPFMQDPRDLIFRTGDLARLLEDGSLQFVGRQGGLVKVRGLRVEPGEIEAALLSHAEVRDAVVVAREDRPGDLRLAAYVVPGAGAAEGSPSAASLRSLLRRTLPEAMIPAAFVRLGRLPLLPNGKVDRQALPAPSREEAAAGWMEARAEGPVEEMLADLWAELLGVERVGLRESFFELGGHSLLATQLIARARDLFEVEVPLRRLLDEPTVAGMAAAVLDADLGADAAAPPRIVRAPRAPRRAPVPLSFAQERLWFLEQLLPGRSDYHVSAALRATGG